MTTDKHNKRPNVPPLRFPEFSGEWNRTSIGECCSSLEYGMNAAAKEYDGRNKYIRITDIDETTSKYCNDDVVSPSGELEDKYLVRENDILFARTGASVGKTYHYDISDGKLYFAGFLIRGNVLSCYNSKFVFYQTQLSRYEKWVKVMSARSGQPGINSQEYEGFNLFMPTRFEQDKIESFISLLDRRIEVQSGLIEDLQKLKAALVERLFCNKQNWRRYKYRDLLTPISERNSRNQFSNVLSASQEFGMVSRTDLDIDIKFDKSAVTTYKIVRDGDYVLHLRSFQGGLAFSSMTGICSPAYTILRPVKELEYGFFQEYFMSRSFINSLRLVTYGIRDGRSINVDEFLDMTVEIPDSTTQRRIISILSTMNSRLRLAIKQNENYNKQKQYLLNEMFI